MSHDAQTWHHGLVARYWATFQEGGPEIDYFQKVIEAGGQPALDVGCGTGRLLLPYLRAGLDVDGTDVSADMLAFCKAKAEAEGLDVEGRLFAQPMHALDLPRAYRSIVVCGAFGLGSSAEDDRAALARFHELLEPGGVLAMNLDAPHAAVFEWPYWMPDKRRELPRDWRPWPPREAAPDGTEFAMRARLIDLDPLDQRVTRQMQVELWRNGEREAEEEHTLTERLYFRNQMVDLLAAAGFIGIQVQTGFTGEPPTADDEVLVYIARKG
jgi:SAM-dependent methyltransferase